jgi:hypothetical protein
METEEDPELQLMDEKEQDELKEYCSQREAISLARLSLCFTERGELDKAITAARQALDIQRNTQTDHQDCFLEMILRLGATSVRSNRRSKG